MRYRRLAFPALLVCSLSGPALAGQNIWTTTGPAPQNIPALVLDPTDPQILYASVAPPKSGTISTLSKSNDGGGSWVQLANPLGNGTVSALAAYGQRVYAGGTSGICKSVNAGESWSLVYNPGSQQFRAIVINPLNTQIVYAGSSNGLYRSMDGGDNWTAISAGLPSANVTALGITAAKPQWLYVGISGAGVYRSADEGGTWAAANNGLPATLSMTVFAVDPQQPATVYVGTGGSGVYKSTDSGDTWTGAGNGLVDKVTCALAIDPTDSQVLFVGTVKGTIGVSRSTDGGNTWAPFNSGLGNTSANALAIGVNTLHAATGAGVYSYSSGVPNQYPPALNVPGSQAVDEGQLLSFAVNASDPDGQPVVITASGLPQGAGFLDKGNGNGVFTWIPGGDQSGVYTVGFSATDGTFGDGPKLVKIAVDEVAQPGAEVVAIPVDPETGATPAKLRFAQVSQAGATTVRVSSSGPPPPPGRKAGNPHAVYDLHTEAIYSGPVDLELDYEPTAFARPAKVRLHHFEGNAWGDVTTQIDKVSKKIHGRVHSFSPFAVFAVNNPPVLAIPVAQTIALGQTLSLEVGASDPDEGDGVTLSVSGLPAEASLADHGNGTWTLTWTPVQAGAYTATFAATDDDSPALSVSQELSITVTVSNQPPVAAAGPDQTVECAGPLTSVALSGAASSDPDGDALTYNWSENGTEVSAEMSPTLSLGRGSHTFTLRVSDGQGGMAVDEVVVNLVDTTAPAVTAALAALSRSRDDHEDEDGNFYRVTATAVDLVDPNPAVSAFITQPLTPSSSMAVSYKKAQKNRIHITPEKRRLQVKLEGPSETALRALWTQALTTGGFSVSDGQEVQLVVKKDKKDEYEAQYRFDTTLKLTSAKGPGLKLAVWAIDAAGNPSHRVEVVPGKRVRSDRDDDDRHAKRTGEGSLPASSGLVANYPNPFNPSTTVPYVLAEAGLVKLSVYNVLGQQVRVLVDQLQTPGTYTVSWDGMDTAGIQVAGGVYFCRLEAGGQIQVRKMLFAK